MTWDELHSPSDTHKRVWLLPLLLRLHVFGSVDSAYPKKRGPWKRGLRPVIFATALHQETWYLFYFLRFQINCFILISVIYVLLTKTMIKAGDENSASKSNARYSWLLNYVKQIHSANHPSYTLRRRSVKITVVLLPLLGLTWLFGFMAVDENTIFFHYLFAVVNSLQVQLDFCLRTSPT